VERLSLAWHAPVLTLRVMAQCAKILLQMSVSGADRPERTATKGTCR
jgi:hypothetical protein